MEVEQTGTEVLGRGEGGRGGRGEGGEGGGGRGAKQRVTGTWVPSYNEKICDRVAHEKMLVYNNGREIS